MILYLFNALRGIGQANKQFMVGCSVHVDTEACPPTPNRVFQFHLEERSGIKLRMCKLGEALKANDDNYVVRMWI